MREFLKIRIKAIKSAFNQKRFLLFQNLIGFNPPFIIEGKRIFNPSFILLYKREVKSEYDRIENRKNLRKMIDRKNEEDRKLAIIALAFESKKRS